MYLVGFIIRIYHDARSPERQIELSIYMLIEETELYYTNSRTIRQTAQQLHKQQNN